MLRHMGQRALFLWSTKWMVLAVYFVVRGGAACGDGEREALLQFKQEVVEADPTGLLRSWNARSNASDCCQWKGVRCRWDEATSVRVVTGLLLGNCNGQDPSNHSVLLHLHQTAFRGSLTSAALTTLALGLPHLSRLDLGCQLLHGSIPPEIGNLTSLSYLDLSFQAQPVNGFGSRLSGFLPPTLWSLPHLQHLDLSYNSLLGTLPHSISNATSLTTLFLTTNNLSGPIPPSLANLSLLSHLDLSANTAFSLLPSSPSWSPSFSLLSLDLSWCSFSGPFPPWLASQTNLSSLSLGANSFSGDIPSWAWSLAADHLDLSMNTFSSHLDCSDSFAPSPSLIIFDISANKLTGTMPCRLSNLTFISILSLSTNVLKGPISSSLGNLTQLHFLDLSENQFEGGIPSPMQHLHFLQVLYLDDNLLSEGVPAFMLQLPSLQVLDLSFNQLSGNIPNSPSTTNPTLAYLKLSHNNLTGSIPPSLSRLTALQVLRLNGNSLTGLVPKHLSLLTELQNLDVSDNNLEGPLPLAMRNMRSLVILIAGFNPNMRGYFPVCVKYLQQLVVLDLRSTNLEGEIPKWVGKRLQQLQVLILSNNLLTGQVPADLVGLTGMKQPGVGAGAQVIASHDELSDDLNIVIKGQTRDYYALQSMAVLDLSANKLWGSIPSKLGELGGLISIDLSGNFLNGSIPESLADLSKLESLDLSNNMLGGEIPHQFSDLTSLAFVNLSNNELSGGIPDGGQWVTFNASSYANNKGLCISANLLDSLSQLPSCSTPVQQASPPQQLATQHTPGLTLQSYMSWTAFGVGYPLGALLVYLFKLALAHRIYIKLWVRQLGGRLLKSESNIASQ